MGNKVVIGCAVVWTCFAGDGGSSALQDAVRLGRLRFMLGASGVRQCFLPFPAISLTLFPRAGHCGGTPLGVARSMV
jgi:hypothetical protein